MPPEPSDDFKPLSAISLDALKQKSDNQRPVSDKHKSDLKSALSSIVREQGVGSRDEVKKETPKANPSNLPPKPSPKKEPTPEELKAILDVE